MTLYGLIMKECVVFVCELNPCHRFLGTHFHNDSRSAHEQLGRAVAIAHLGHEQGQGADPHGELARFVAIATPQPMLTALVGRHLQLLRNLRVQDLVQDVLHQAAQLAVSGQQALHAVTI